MMQAVVELPSSFSVCDDRELQLVQDLMARMNPLLLVTQVATGLHVNGGRTVNWVVVHLIGQRFTEMEVRTALSEAGLDFRHNEEIQPSRVWVNNHPDVIEKTLT
jgi:hypothetical protein